ncbi:non-hydrolyzing UDP-N-acetylglucosamine 2-epimerase [Campylobacter geochelonis]|uniref:non-hydrolyzing UDP-N-acetylglucosamine 2-epimerase n=1 Tax=Campylobacter geochelonis TaxID=1780362 RepID=UPI0007708707|nr:UDP-N-acetylglucosamine 2-epimerase (non-hydrolyzing) [Campylobacter geochelonis]CZE49288.1 UDP-N-acetylglucosamine 2-epimerase [Campylobacter geochelonis]
MKILTILGARPQFIKAGSLSREIAKHSEIQEIIIHTGQHYDENMSDIFFDEMKIPKPDYFLGVGGKSHGEMTGQMMAKIEEITINQNPDYILVYGDTNSTLAGALVATKLHIKLAHVEAGLRSFNMKMPEEINRILTDRISNILFCPTKTAVKNLQNEAFPFFAGEFKQEICNVGDIMQDGAIFYSNFAKKPSFKIDESYLLCTIHRAENTDDISRLSGIITALNQLSQNRQIILPIHPRTKKILESSNIKIAPNLLIIPPVGYLEMVWLIANSKLILSDSGGLQKEAYFFHKNCIVLRDETEWVELVKSKFNVIGGTNSQNILNLYENFNFNKDFSVNLYGDGNTAKAIVEKLLAY